MLFRNNAPSPRRRALARPTIHTAHNIVDDSLMAQSQPEAEGGRFLRHVVNAPTQQASTEQPELESEEGYERVFEERRELQARLRETLQRYVEIVQLFCGEKMSSQSSARLPP